MHPFEASELYPPLLIWVQYLDNTYNMLKSIISKWKREQIFSITELELHNLQYVLHLYVS